MPKRKILRTFCHPIRVSFLIAAVTFNAWTATACAQTRIENPYYARLNSFGILGAYSGDSSHILLGEAENRRLLEIGVSYNRRLLLNRTVNWQYSGELLPLVIESDPTGIVVEKQTSPTVQTLTFSAGPVVSCAPNTESYSFTDPNSGVKYSGTTSISCNGRRSVVGEAMSPIGMQFNFMPSRKAQPFVDGHGGYMYSSQTIPIDDAGSFNFTFDIGAGFEIYRSKSKSIRAEYRYHHISNNNTAAFNPGIDNGMIQVTYAFGR